MAEVTSTAIRTYSAPPPLQRYSCVICARRKVRCDRHVPCHNCEKANTICEYRDPASPLRKRRKQANETTSERLSPSTQSHSSTPAATSNNEAYNSKPAGAMTANESLQKELERCRELLRSMGVPSSTIYEDDDGPNNNNLDTLPNASKNGGLRENTVLDGKMVDVEGERQYYENEQWADVHQEFGDVDDTASQDPEEEDTELPMDMLDGDLFTACVNMPIGKVDLIQANPPPAQMEYLWHTFCQNVDPLTKTCHVPTVDQWISKAKEDISSIEPKIQAYLFSMYCAAVNSLSNEECLLHLQSEKAPLYRKFHQACGQALIHLEFLKTNSRIVLTAFVNLLGSMRMMMDPTVVWVMSGIALRLAAKQGLHRDGTKLKLPVFETEMRRRLWWHIFQLDGMSAHHTGYAVFRTLENFDTHLPLNVNDEDLYLEMTDFPKEHVGPTDVMFMRMRYDITDWIRQRGWLDRRRHAGNFWSGFTKNEVDSLEEYLELGYLRFCDPLNPVHALGIMLGRSIILACRSGQLLDEASTTSTSATLDGAGNDKIASAKWAHEEAQFTHRLKHLSYYGLIAGTPALHRFAWHYQSTFKWDNLIYVLEFLRRYPNYHAAADAWSTLDTVFECHPIIIQWRRRRRIHAAVCRLALHVWELHEQSTVQTLQTPKFILDLRASRTGSASSALSVANSKGDISQTIPQHEQQQHKQHQQIQPTSPSTFTESKEQNFNFVSPQAASTLSGPSDPILEPGDSFDFPTEANGFSFNFPGSEMDMQLGGFGSGDGSNWVLWDNLTNGNLDGQGMTEQFFGGF